MLISASNMNVGSPRVSSVERMVVSFGVTAYSRDFININRHTKDFSIREIVRWDADSIPLGIYYFGRRIDEYDRPFRYDGIFKCNCRPIRYQQIRR